MPRQPDRQAAARRPRARARSSTPRPGWKKWARSWRTSDSHFYSDSHNDLPLMSIVSHPVATNPNDKLKRTPPAGH
jgi:phosphoserine phosphatase